MPYQIVESFTDAPKLAWRKHYESRAEAVNEARKWAAIPVTVGLLGKPGSHRDYVQVYEIRSGGNYTDSDSTLVWEKDAR